jgi:hypothetical protein
MPSVFLRRSTAEYLKKQSNGESMDATICRLLNLDEGANGKGLVVRHTPKEKLADSFAYTWTILDQLQAFDPTNPQLARSVLQTKVHDILEFQDLFVMFPDDESQDKRKQPKWKQRFTNSLSLLNKMGCIEARGKAPDARKQERGVQYRATDYGLSVIKDIGLHICPRRELPATQEGESRDGHCYLYTVRSHSEGRDTDGNEICPKPLVKGEIPKALASRTKLIDDGTSLAESQEPIDWASAVSISPKS